MKVEKKEFWLDWTIKDLVETSYRNLELPVTIFNKQNETKKQIKETEKTE